ncbi:MAG: putative DNA binding domain-containing protein [Prevotella sp.]|jgi:ATP-dependent DNA helicase RecG|nr:putative DNA binding domain-containing protein [Prevotella sp.]
MPEKQNEEYKQSWHEDYLKWICGFANAQGGTIYIGKDDIGNIVGITDSKKLMDDLPNKIRNSMGITSEVNLLESDSKKYIEIVTPAYNVPVSLRGRYYYRSGSTNQELTGNTLNDFLLKKSGQTWDDVIEPRVKMSDIDVDSLKTYLSAAEKAGRLPADIKELSTTEILEKLRLVEDGKLKRAAIILFGKDPAKFYPNTFVKIGRFSGKDNDIVYQEVIEGNLISVLKSVVEQLNIKFLIRLISFEGLQRIEKNQYPIEALREMLLNALIHRNYLGAATQIRIYDNKISIWNDGQLPNGISIETLKRTHASKPHNPILADVSFKGGYIDSWGRGTLKIINVSKEANLPEPVFQETDGGFMVTLYNSNDGEGVTEGVTEGVKKDRLAAIIEDRFTNQGIPLKAKLELLLKAIAKEEGRRTNEYKDITGIKAKTLERYIGQLRDAGLIEFRGSSPRIGGYYLKDEIKKDK